MQIIKKLEKMTKLLANNSLNKSQNKNVIIFIFANTSYYI